MGSPSATGTRTEAVVCDAPGMLTVRSVRLPEAGPRDVLISVQASGISTGTDRWVLQGVFVWRDISYPIIPGYQAAGVVEWVGDEVADVVVGQAVATTAGRAGPDVAAAWGTHAAWVLADAADVYDVSGVPPRRAAFLVSAQVGFNAASRLDLPAGAPVAVIGDGIIGACGALAARARGLDVVVVGRRAARLRQIAALGLVTVPASEATLAIARHRVLGVIDTVQNPDAFAAYVDALPRARGQLVYSGHSPGGVTAWADMAALQKREITVHFVAGMLPHRLLATITHMRDGTLPVDALVGRTATDAASTLALFEDVAAGALHEVAAAVDWGWAS